MSALARITDSGQTSRHVRKVPIVLQKSKVASVRIFGETLKRKAIDDSDTLSRVTEVAYEFSVRR
jgi:predicted nucleotidyltransferase